CRRRMHFYDKPVIRPLNRLSEKRRSFKRGLWGSCVATLMPHKAILLSRRDAAPPASFHLNVAKDRFCTDYPPHKKAPGSRRGLFSVRDYGAYRLTVMLV